jgi:two-component system response regulator AtoC
MLTADTSLGTGIEAMRLGAYDYLTKPATLDEIEAVIRKADEKRRLVRQNASLRTPSAGLRKSRRRARLQEQGDGGARRAGRDGRARRLDRHHHRRVGHGQGRARALHTRAQPARRLARDLGQLRGAPRDALRVGVLRPRARRVHRRDLDEARTDRGGRLSTLFLDEVGEMPAQTQVKLLRFLEEGRFRRVGSTRDRASDVRVIAATNRNLAEDVTAGRFRADLFYRLNVISLHVRRFAMRREDIPALVEHFLALFRERFNRPALDLSRRARGGVSIPTTGPATCASYATVLERAAALAVPATLIEADQLLPRPQSRARRRERQQHLSSDEGSLSTSTPPRARHARPTRTPTHPPRPRRSRAATASAPPPSSASPPAPSTANSANTRRANALEPD